MKFEKYVYMVNVLFKYFQLGNLSLRVDKLQALKHYWYGLANKQQVAARVAAAEPAAKLMPPRPDPYMASGKSIIYKSNKPWVNASSSD